MHLLCVFKHSQVSKFDFGLLLKLVIDAIKQLEEGAAMQIYGRVEIIRGTLTALVADNLASHQIGGFKCGFSSGFRKCRTCLVLEEDIKTKYSHCEFQLRNKKEHLRYCSAMEVKGLKSHFQKILGLKCNSILNSFKYFSVTGGLVPDIMHDLLEGVLGKVTCEVISHCIDSRLFSLKVFNKLIKKFNYGHAEIKDRPSPITSDH